MTLATTARLTGPCALEFKFEERAVPAPGEVLCGTLLNVISPGTWVFWILRPWRWRR